ncbi:hypothetical protein CB0940_12113 [Cercospora beticola]|uniref:RNase H type-1 domain-containing protein n=1 Tax=Cercospora beticola TaxID=122368 RepID=A0A2G5GIB6_CERBT|nr:hypothetical protein CB0940_12113 [Cercospora beticola]PIA80028.1 hypothetical protein CB0940_12113 [Cercospora beticola]WPB07679.1 hypothetical protein RHO25_012340 [Cercospora beticola]
MRVGGPRSGDQHAFDRIDFQRQVEDLKCESANASAKPYRLPDRDSSGFTFVLTALPRSPVLCSSTLCPAPALAPTDANETRRHESAEMAAAKTTEELVTEILAAHAAAGWPAPTPPPPPPPTSLLPPPPRRQQIFTDGSWGKQSTFGGCAFVAFVRQSNRWQGMAFTLGRIPDSLTAEIAGISFALSWAIANKDLPCDEWMIRTDCKKAIDVIGEQLRADREGEDLVRCGDDLLEAIVWKARTLRKMGKSVRMTWIPGHTVEDDSEAEGNRIADDWALKMSLLSEKRNLGLGQHQEEFWEYSEH